MSCLRTWIPLMIQALHTARVNGFIAHKHICTKPVDHKTFLLTWCRVMKRRAVMLVRRTRNSLIHVKDTGSPTKRFRFSDKNPSLPEVRHSQEVTHVAVIAASQGKCIYCRYLHLCKKIENPDADPRSWGVVRQPMRKCIGCGYHLCRDCFDSYHS